MPEDPIATPPVTPPTTPPEGSTPPWYEGADELTTGYVQNKGWTSPLEAVKSYQNLEKLMGADRAGNTVVIPKADAPPEEMGKFYERLGRPLAPEDYKLPVPDGANPEYAKAASAKLFELGVSKSQAQALAEWNNAQVQATLDAQAAAKEQAYQADDLALKGKWGAAFTQELAKAQAAARGLGVTAETIDHLQASMGHKATMEFFHKIGSMIGEPDFVMGAGKEPFGAAMTPAQAKAEIASLTSDKTFVAKYASGDAEAKAKMQRLHEFAYPEGA